MGICEEMKASCQAVWRSQFEHPFVRGVGEGTLDEAKFRFYLEQDYLFLVERARTYAIAASKATQPEVVAIMARRAAELLDAELARLEGRAEFQFREDFGITEGDLAAVGATPTTRGYTGHLHQVASTGGLAEILAASLPCPWLYSEIGQTLKAAGLPKEPRYRRWIEFYASPVVAQKLRQMQELLERQAHALARPERQRLMDHFRWSVRWEYMFWDAAWRMEPRLSPADEAGFSVEAWAPRPDA